MSVLKLCSNYDNRIGMIKCIICKQNYCKKCMKGKNICLNCYFTEKEILKI